MPDTYAHVDGFDGPAELFATLGFARPRWMARSRCKGQTEVMFDGYRVAEALTICSVCNVFESCRDWALSAPEVPERCVVGGYDPKALKAARRARGLRRRGGSRDATA